jgi:hypothetical protein
VAALALQQAAKTDPQDDVVRQVTLLDSPEDNQAEVDFTNPVYLDAANYDWYYLSQLQMPGRRAVTGTIVDSRTITVSGPNTQYLVDGMGVTGPGIAAGTTISVNAGKTQVTLSIPLSGDVTAGSSIDLLFWDWSNHAIFVDSYVSHFGADYNNFTVGSQSLYNIVDVNLDADAVFHNGLRDIGLRHEYAANWYAGSASKPQGQQVGLLWSPLIASAVVPLARSSQNWSPVEQDQQFVLTPQSPASPVQPTFQPMQLIFQGNVIPTISSVSLSSDQPDFMGSIPIPDGFDEAIGGFSFDFTFGSQVSEDVQLQILVNGDQYFGMTSTVPRSGPTAASGHFSSTFGLTAEWQISGGRPPILPQPTPIEIRLVRTDGQSGPLDATTVTLDNFQVFRLY